MEVCKKNAEMSSLVTTSPSFASMYTFPAMSYSGILSLISCFNCSRRSYTSPLFARSTSHVFSSHCNSWHNSVYTILDYSSQYCNGLTGLFAA